MTQEEKELVLQDLLGRLPYGVTIKDEYGDYINVNLYTANLEHLIDRVGSGIDKLALRSFESMNMDERIGIYDLVYKLFTIYYMDIVINGNDNLPPIYDWVNRNNFDWRHLIKKGLAVEMPEDLYNS